MDALKRFGAVLALILAHPAHADSVTRWRPLTSAAAARTGLPLAWIEQVMRAESAGHATRNGRAIRSDKGAMGLMQLMPGTWAQLRAELGLGFDPDDPHDNILAGSVYLRRMYDRFGYPGCLAAYHAGPARYGAYLAGRQGLPSTTRAYVAGILGTSPAPEMVPPVPVSAPIFVPLGPDRLALPSASDGLFVRLGAARP